MAQNLFRQLLAITLSLGLSLAAYACNSDSQSASSSMAKIELTPEEIAQKGYETITLGSGCFWCTEAVFEDLNGVISAVSGYSGGHVDKPTYKEVCSATTGHAEVVQVIFDPKKVSLEQVLEVFWATHDPTTLNRQGNDVGPQYRSAVFYHNDAQRMVATKIKEKLNADKVFPNPIVTEITGYKNFYPAENYHQEYFALNGHEPYCQFVIKPKLDKFRKAYAAILKEKK